MISMGMVFFALTFFGQTTRAQTTQLSSNNQITLSAHILNNNKTVLKNGTYAIRFSIYTTDRQTLDPYPSNADAGARVWQETQQVNVNEGFISVYLGSVTPFPATLTFSNSQYYLGIMIDSDSEMAPRKKIGAVASAIDAFYLQGKTVGNQAGNIPLLDPSGKLALGLLPTGAGANQLVLGNDGRLHSQNTDLGTTSSIFNLGSGAGLGSTNFDLAVSNTGNKPALRYESATGVWKISNDGASFNQILTTATPLDLANIIAGALPASHGGTGIASYLGGDILFASDSTTLASLPIGTDGYCLKVRDGIPSWESCISGSQHNLLSSLHPDTEAASVQRGDLISGQGSTPFWKRLPLGANGTVLRSVDGDATWRTLTKADLGLGNVEDVALSTWGVLGTITTGVWQGSTISTHYGGTGLDGAGAGFGALLIGNGSGYTLATLTPDAGISIANTAGAISIASTLGTSVDLTSEVNGILPVVAGGTGATTFSSGGVVYGNGIASLGATLAGTTGQLLLVNDVNIPYFASVTGDASLTSAGLLTVGTGAISGTKIADNTIKENNLAATNEPTAGYILTYDALGRFTWISNTGGSGASKWTDAGAYTYLSQTGDNLALGSSSAIDAPLFFDVAANSILFQGSTINEYRTTLTLADPTANRTLTLPNASGELSALGQTIETGEIANGNILGADLNFTGVTGAPRDGEVLVYDNATGGFGSVAIGSGGIGDITAIGDVTTNDAFTATSTQGKSLWFYNNNGNRGQLTLANIANPRVYTLPDADGTIITTGNFPDITQLAVITNGTWNGSAIGTAYGGTGLDTSALTGVATVASGAWNIASTLTSTLGGTGLDTHALSGVPTLTSGTWSVSPTLSVARGGTGLNGAAAGYGALLIGNGSGYSLGTLTAGSGISITNAASTITIASIFGNTIDLGSAVNGVLPIISGGTGAASLTPRGVVLGNGTGPLSATAPGSAGQILISDGSLIPAFVSFSGDALLSTAGVFSLGTGAVTGSKIANSTIKAVNLASNNIPDSGYILSYDAFLDRFVWITNSGGAGASKWTDAGNYTYLTSATDNLVLGGLSTSDSAFFFDMATGNLSFEGPTIDQYETILHPTDPTADRLVTIPDASGEISLLGQSIETGEITSGTILPVNLATANAGAEGQVLIYNSVGNNFRWSSAGSGGIGDITSVGNALTGDVFSATGTSVAAGTALYFYDAQGKGQLTINDLTAARTYFLPDATGTIITSGNLSDIVRTGTVANGTWNGGVIDPLYGGTGSAANFTKGSVVFAGNSGAYSQSNTSFFWDNTNARLGLGVTTPAGRLDVRGAGTGTGIALQTQSSTGTLGLVALDNGNIGIGTTGPTQQLTLTNSLALVDTTSATTGVIYKGANSFIHNYTATGTTGGNFFAGINAGNFTMTGTTNQASFNVGIGQMTLTALTSGSYNVATGYATLAGNTTGNQNSAFGYNALFSNTTGSGNIAFGAQAGQFQADGTTALTDPENSIYLGAGARGLSNADSNSIVIGADALGLGANTTVIGNASTTLTKLFGNLNLAASSYLNWGSNMGLAGYGLRDNGGVIEYKNASGSWLSISAGAGGMAIGSNIASVTPGSILFANATGNMAQDNGNLFWDYTNSRLGLGTTTPLYLLDASKATDDYLARIYNTSTGVSAGGLSIRTDGSGNLLNLNAGGADIVTISEAASIFNNPTSFMAVGDVSMAYDLLLTNQTSSLIASSGPLAIEAGELFESNDLTLRTYNAGQVVLDSAGGIASNQAQNWLLADGTSALNFTNSAGTSLLNIDSTNGRVGIGTATPGAVLDIMGSAIDILIGEDNVSKTRTNLTTKYGRIGAFHYTNSEEPMSIVTTRSDGSGNVLIFGGGTSMMNAATAITFVTATNVTTVSGTERMRIDANGYVGIGTTSPTYKLDVNGLTATDGIRSDMGFDMNPVVKPTFVSGNLALASGGSNLGIGAYIYTVTYLTAVGETDTSGGSPTITTDASNRKVTVTVPVSSDPRVTGRRIYRTAVGGANWATKVLTTINDNTTTSYLDDIADGSLTGSTDYFRSNTTSKYISINGLPAFSLTANTEANTFFGYQVGNSTLTSGRNVAFGSNSMPYLTSGGQNVAVGSYALSTVNTGSSNVAMGFGASEKLTSGGNNVAIGNIAGSLNQTGSNNTAIGNQALLGVIGNSYSNNTAVGSASLFSLSSGSSNTGLGTDSGHYIANGSTGNLTGGTSVFLGANTKALADGQSNQIVIGYNATGLGSNSVVLGNDSITTTALKGNVGIGTTSPLTNLSIHPGAVSKPEPALGTASGTFSMLGNGGLYGLYAGVTGAGNVWLQSMRNDAATAYALELNPSGGNVGIGTTNPSVKLQIVGGDVRIDDGYFYRVSGGSAVMGTASSGTVVRVGTSDAKDLSFYAGATDRMYILNSNGNVGIGTATPATKLDVNGSVRFLGTTNSTPVNGELVYDTVLHSYKYYDGTDLTWKTLAGGTINVSGGYWTQNGTDLYYASGNVGVGTTTPTHKLDVAGNLGLSTSAYLNFGVTDGTNGYGFRDLAGVLQYKNSGGAWSALNTLSIGSSVTSATAGSIFFGGTAGILAQNNANLFWDNSNTRLGIGTATPSNILSLGNAQAQKFWIENSATDVVGRALTVGAGSTIAGTSISNVVGGQLILQSGLGTGTGDSSIAFQTGTTLGTGTTLQTMSTKMTILGNGNVGIGTTDPSAGKLEITGNLGFSNDGSFPERAIRWGGDNVRIVGKANSYLNFYAGSGGELGITIKNGNVGLGTTNPTNLLSLGGASARTIWMERNTTAATAGQGLTLASGGAFSTGTDLAGGDLLLKSGISTGTGSSALRFFTATAGTTGSGDNTPTEKLTILGNGNVGIGTTNPGEKLNVYGTDNKLRLSYDGSNYANLYANGGGTLILQPVGYVDIMQTHGLYGFLMHKGSVWGGQGLFGVKNDFTISTGAITQDIVFNGANFQSGTETMRIKGNGNVGIGTTAPTNLLSLGGASARTIWMERNTTAATAGQGLTLASGGAFSTGTDLSGGDLLLKSGISTGTGSSTLRFFTATAGTTGSVDNTPTEKMTILGNGNVGIGTGSPVNKLDVVSSGSEIISAFSGDGAGYARIAVSTVFGEDSQVSFMNGGGTRWSIGNDGTDDSFHINNGAGAFMGGSELAITSTGNVGIGTTTPASRLHVGVAPTASANYGTLSIGGGPFDGSTAGKFVGSANGTSLAVNEATGYTGNLMDLQVGGLNKFKVEYNGTLTGAGFSISSLGSAHFNGNLQANVLTFLGSVPSTLGVLRYSSTISDTGNQNVVRIAPVYNQIASTASNTDILINRTETSVGSGTQMLIDAQVGGVSKFYVTNVGKGYFANNVRLAASAYLNFGATDGTGGYGLRDNGGVIEYKNATGAWTSILASAGGMTIGGAITSGTPGSILFSSTSSTLAQDNANFYYDQTNHRLGLGTATPTERLDLNGSARIYDQTATTGVTTLSLRAGAGQASTGLLQWQDSAGVGLGIIDGTGKVGIGTTTPGAKLDVAGSVRFMGATNATPVDGEFVYDSVAHYYKYYDAATASWKSLAGGTINMSGGFWNQSGTNLYYSAGNVGIGMTTPTTALDVAGVITATGGSSTNWNQTYAWGNHATMGYLTGSTVFTLSGDVTGTGTGGIISTSLGSGSVTSAKIADNTIKETDLAETTGTPMMGQILAYDSVSGGFSWIDNTGGTGASKWTDASTYSYLTNVTNNIVLGSTGTTDAPFLFDVATGNITFEGSVANGYETTLALTDPTADRTITIPDISGTLITTGNLSAITDLGTIATGTWNAGAITTTAAIQGSTLAATSMATGSVVFINGAGLLVQDNAGLFYDVATHSLGLGTTTPTAMLQVGSITNPGNARIDNGWLCVDSDGTCSNDSPVAGSIYSTNLATTGADYAEYFYTKDTNLQAGEAVCLDLTVENGVKRCQNNGDNNLMGIVSSNPSIVGNKAHANDQNYKIIGMLGQVSGKVSTENGSVKVGDSLTAGSKPGEMRKANAGESTVGIALQNFSDPTGSIQILISRRNQSLTVEKVTQAVTDNIAALNLQDQVDNLIAQASKNLDSQLSTQAASLIDLQLQLTEAKTMTSYLQAQLDLIKTQNQTITEFIAILDPTKLIYKDTLGNLDLSEGKITAKDLEVLGTLEAQDIEAKNSLKAQDLQLGTQVSGAGVIKAGELESAKILTTQVGPGVKLYLTPKGSTNGKMLYYDEADIEAGVSFKVKIDAPALEKELEFNWLIVK